MAMYLSWHRDVLEKRKGNVGGWGGGKAWGSGWSRSESGLTPKLYLLAHSLQIIQLAWQSFVMMYVPCLHLSAIDQSIAK